MPSAHERPSGDPDQQPPNPPILWWPGDGSQLSHVLSPGRQALILAFQDALTAQIGLPEETSKPPLPPGYLRSEVAVNLIAVADHEKVREELKEFTPLYQLRNGYLGPQHQGAILTALRSLARQTPNLQYLNLDEKDERGISPYRPLSEITSKIWEHTPSTGLQLAYQGELMLIIDVAPNPQEGESALWFPIRDLPICTFSRRSAAKWKALEAKGGNPSHYMRSLPQAPSSPGPPQPGYGQPRSPKLPNR